MGTEETPAQLRMVGGTGHGSYHHFSKSLQSNLNVFFRPQLSQSIVHACDRQLLLNNNADDAEALRCFAIADFGCACAGNTVESMHFIANSVDAVLRTSDAHSPRPDLHIQAFFNDLPSNDFNALFALLSSRSATQTGPYFMSCGLPGSFYSRLFPPGYLRIGLCTLALHNLSKVPDAVQNPTSPAWNENGTWINEGCKAETFMAYKKQFLDDFTSFLQHRSQELVPGGLLFCVMISAVPADKAVMYRGEQPRLIAHVQTAWRQLISEGLLDQKSLDEFNIPTFRPTLDEVKEVVYGTAVGATFDVLEIQYVEAEQASKNVWKEAAADAQTWGRSCEMMVRNFVGSLIQSHLGPVKFELLMERLRTVAAAANDNLQNVNILHVIVLALLRR